MFGQMLKVTSTIIDTAPGEINPGLCTSETKPLNHALITEQIPLKTLAKLSFKVFGKKTNGCLKRLDFQSESPCKGAHRFTSQWS